MAFTHNSTAALNMVLKGLFGAGRPRPDDDMGTQRCPAAPVSAGAAGNGHRFYRLGSRHGRAAVRRTGTEAAAIDEGRRVQPRVERDGQRHGFGARQGFLPQAFPDARRRRVPIGWGLSYRFVRRRRHGPVLYGP